MELNSVVSPIENFVNAVMGPLFLLLGVGGVIYIIYLIVKVVISPWDKKSNAVSHLFTAVGAYFVIFILVYLLQVYSPALKLLIEGDRESIKEVTFDYKKPFQDAVAIFQNSRESLKNGTVSENVTEATKSIMESGETLLQEEMEGIPKAIDEIGENMPTINSEGQ